MANKTDLINQYRAATDELLSNLQTLRAVKAEYDALGFSFADGDFTGANGDLTASQFTTTVGNLESIYNAIFNGGTLPVGLPTNLYRLKT